MRYRIGLLCCVSLWTAAPAAHAVSSEFQSWAALFVGKDVGDPSSGLTLWFDGHARRGGDNTVVIIRPAVGYRFFPGLAVHGGYAWVPTFNDGATSDVQEHRAWQQLLWSPRPLQSLLINVRPRFEQRFASGGNDLGLRLRLFLRANWRFGTSPLLLACWDELFVPVNDTDWGQRAGFDQNRIFIGPGLVGFDGMRIEVGYLNVYLNRSTNQLNHNLALNLFLTY